MQRCLGFRQDSKQTIYIVGQVIRSKDNGLTAHFRRNWDFEGTNRYNTYSTILHFAKLSVGIGDNIGVLGRMKAQRKEIEGTEAK